MNTENQNPNDYAATPPSPRRSGIGWMPYSGILIGCGCMIIPFIAIMAAILFPVFAKAREKAMQTICQSNLKQLSLGVLMYAQDHNDEFPPPDKWMDSILPYIKDPELLKCPRVKNLSLPSYAMNSYFKGISIAKVKSPGETVLLFDSITGRNRAGDVSILTPAPRHMGGDNIGYADGHVKWDLRSGVAGLNWDPLSAPKP